MPELPEVEVARRALVRWLDGREVVAAWGDAKARTFRGADLKRFTALRGRLVSAARTGKYLRLVFSNGTGLVLHLGMTGKLVRRGADVAEPYSRARVELDSGEIVHFRDPRMFGRIEPVDATQVDHVAAVAKLGPDWLVDAPTADAVAARLGKSSQPIKVALMDQEKFAGLGNIHAAEALFRAGLHPSRPAKSLTPAEWKALKKAIDAALQYALEHEDGDEIRYVEEPGADNPFFIYGRAGEKCSRCKKTVVKALTQGGRTTHLCPTCQPLKPKKKPGRKS